jgi:F-type H+-transporting ATPase subunit b
MTFNVWTFLFEILNFIVLAFVLQRLLYRPLRDAIEKRKADNEKARTDAEVARQEAEAAREQLAAKVAATDKDRLDVLRKASEQADAEQAKRLAEAEVAAKTIRSQAQHDAEQLRRDTLTGLEGEVGTMAVNLAQRLLTQACDADLNAQLARHLVAALQAIPGEERDRVRRDVAGGAVIIEAASSLDEKCQRDLAAAVHEFLGHSCEVRFEVKPGLVGGALARLGGHVWDATVAAQLEAAKAALVRSGDGKSQ